MTMPSNLRGLGDSKDLPLGRLKGIKTSFNLAVVEDSHRCSILNKKMPRVKLKINTIVMSKSVDGDKILIGLWKI
jgi:hypothetical protein